MNFQHRIATVVFLFLIPNTHLSANAGTPVMWAGILHLFFLNFLIGIFEGYWLRNITHKLAIARPWYDPYLRLILANYTSAAIGFFLLIIVNLKYPLKILDVGGTWEGFPIFSLELALACAVAYPLSVIIEMPFISTFAKQKTSSRLFDLILSAKFNLASHLALYAFYFLFQVLAMNF